MARHKKTADEMRKYKRNWARAHTGLQGLPKNCKNQNTDKTHCIRGHELSGDNLVIKNTSDGERHRICRTCRNADARQRAEVKRQEEDKLDPERKAALRL